MIVHRTLNIFTFFIISVLSIANIAYSQSGASHKLITFDDLYKNSTFTYKTVPGFNVMNDGLHYTLKENAEGGAIQINQYKLSNGNFVETLYDNSQQSFDNKQLFVEDYIMDESEKKILLLTESSNIYRRSVLHKVYIYDRVHKDVSLLDTSLVLHPSFNADATQIAFVKQNNLYIKDLQSGLIKQITKDGERNHIINGNCDWVYEEEFEFTQAYQWSPNGRYIAFYRFDESKVKEYTLPIYDSIYPTMYTYKYPKAGEANSVVDIFVYDTKTNNLVKADINSEQDQYIPRVKWATENELCVYRLNRLQNKLDLLLTDASSGNTKTIYSEDNRYFIKINDNLKFIPNTTSFLFTSERDGWNHLYQYDWQTKHLQQITSGNWGVEDLLGIDIKQNTAWFTSGMQTPTERKLYAVNIKNLKINCLTPANGWHSITACNGYKFFLDAYSNINTPPNHYLIDTKGNKMRTLADNQDLKNTMAAYDLGSVEILQVPGADSTMLNAWMITPPQFDKNKRYPVLMYQYSGPGSQEVVDMFPLKNYFWHQMLAQKGYIIFCVDGTGTGGRGEHFEKKTYLQLGKYESDDQIAVATYLSKQSYVDASRIGIWGWSYGGFMSSTCILKGADVFKTAVSVAPVTNWRYYDNIYTERYMRTPQENPQGYDDNAPENMAEKLRGNFLLIHGTADDNVHFQNAAMLSKKLIDADKFFETAYYPDKNHGISGGMTRRQLFERITNFIEKNL